MPDTKASQSRILERPARKAARLVVAVTGPVTCCSRVSAHGITAKAAPRAPAPAPAYHARLYRASTPPLRPVILARSIDVGSRSEPRSRWRRVSSSRQGPRLAPLRPRAPARRHGVPRFPPTRSGLGRLRRCKGYGESWLTFGSAASRSPQIAGRARAPSRSDGQRGGGLGRASLLVQRSEPEGAARGHGKRWAREPPRLERG